MIFAITGASKGMGAATAQILKAQGHDVLNIDYDHGDICADLGTAEGRQTIIDEVRSRYPDGLDALISNAGIAGVKGEKPSYVLSVNYFGAVAIMEGLFDLVEKKQGNIVQTVSYSVGFTKRSKYFIDNLLLQCGDEKRIGEFVDSAADIPGFPGVYVSSKMGLVRWVRRKAPSWAARGVTLNAVAPGGVDTTIIPGMKDNKEVFNLQTMGIATPTVYYAEDMMRPADVAGTLAFMATHAAKGNVGGIIYCDGGTTALFNNTRY
jgi:NAD(P)-dependent dehydrogenase (short-subunit alcohol dehydrogenase family)